VAIQPRFDAHRPQRFPGGEQEHPERIGIQLGQPVQRHLRGLQLISLIAQRDQILGNGLRPFATKVRGNDCVHIIGHLSRGVNDP
jgi:hypothetical protein